MCGVCVYVWGGGPFPHNETAGVVSSSRDLLKPELCQAALDREEKAAGAEPASAAGAVVYVIVFKCNPPSQTPHPNPTPTPGLPRISGKKRKKKETLLLQSRAEKWQQREEAPLSRVVCGGEGGEGVGGGDVGGVAAASSGRQDATAPENSIYSV